MGLRSAVFWLCLVAFLTITWWLFDLPSEPEMIAMVKEWLLRYGFGVILVGSFFETLFCIGLYFPGSILIFLGVGLAPDWVSAIMAVGMVNVGMFIGYNANYILGKYGWYRLFISLGMRQGLENAQANIMNNNFRYVLYTFWNPGLGPFTTTAAGIVQLPYSRFVFVVTFGLLLWNTFWGLLVYSLGERALQLINVKTAALILIVWVIYELGSWFWYHYRQRWFP